MKIDTLFSSPRLVFRALQEEDAELMVKWRSNPKVYKYYKNPHPITLTEHKLWFNNRDKSNRFDFIIINKEDRKPIGFLALSCPPKNISRYEISYTIGEVEFQHRGFAKEAVLALIEYSTTFLNINRFSAVIHTDNTVSRKLVLSLGFKNTQEGIFCIYERDIPQVESNANNNIKTITED